MAPPYKLVLLGDSSVGKTSLVHRFANDHFDPLTSNTIGAAFITKEYQSVNNVDKNVKFEIWDTAGQERYRSLTPMYYRNAKIALLCYDLSNIQESFEKSKYWINQLTMANEGLSEKMKIIIVGTKSDLLKKANAAEISKTDTKDTTMIISEEQQTSNMELDLVNTFCLENNLAHHFTSAKSGQGIQELFSSIIDDIDDSFWNEYSKRREEEEEATRNGHPFGSIDFLNSRFRNAESPSKCC